jgi:hypothetical protein
MLRHFWGFSEEQIAELIAMGIVKPADEVAGS